jgi:hypothetical protein
VNPLCTCNIGRLRIEGYQRGNLLGTLRVVNTQTNTAVRNIEVNSIPLHLRPVENTIDLVQYNTGLNNRWNTVNLTNGTVIYD